jgi:ribosomal protein S18 acetylase RimI-like enzyme
MSMVVRRATAADRETVAQLLTAQLVEHALPAERARIDAGLDAAFAPHSPSWLVLAERDGAAVGVLLGNVGASVEKGGRGLWIEELYVAPQARRSGVARAILGWLAGEAHAAGVVALDLEVVPTQAAAFALYAALGFVRVDRARLQRTL